MSDQHSDGLKLLHMRHEGAGIRFLAVDRLVHQKGFDRLLDSMTEMPNVTIAQAGAPFAAAMRTVADRSSIALRPSALPPAFRMDQVSKQLAALLETAVH